MEIERSDINILDCQIVNYILQNIQCKWTSGISVNNQLALILFSYTDLNGKRYSVVINYSGDGSSPYIESIKIKSLQPIGELLGFLLGNRVMSFFYDIQEGNPLMYDM